MNIYLSRVVNSHLLVKARCAILCAYGFFLVFRVPSLNRDRSARTYPCIRPQNSDWWYANARTHPQRGGAIIC